MNNNSTALVEELETVLQELRRLTLRVEEVLERHQARSLKPGDTVRINDNGLTGVVSKLTNKRVEVKVTSRRPFARAYYLRAHNNVTLIQQRDENNEQQQHVRPPATRSQRQQQHQQLH